MAVKVAFDIGAAVILSIVAYTSIRGVGLAPAELFVLLVLFLQLAPQLSVAPGPTIRPFWPTCAFLSLQDTEDHLAAAAPAPDTGMVRDRTPFRHDVRLEQVTFSYGSGTVLAGLDLRIPAGGIVAIVGASGVGKTTAADLVMGLLQPQSGRVMVDGVELTPDRRQTAWREQIGYVPQETFLFHDTVEQPPVGRASRDRSRRRHGAFGGRRRRVRATSPPRSRHRGGRPRRPAFRRRTAATGARARVAAGRGC